MLHHSIKPWQFDDTSDEEVPVPSIFQASIRKARAVAHVRKKLLALQTEGISARITRSTSNARRTNQSPPSTARKLRAYPVASIATDELGIIAPRRWMKIDRAGVFDRTWLHEVNPYVFDEDGIMYDVYADTTPRPPGVPHVYWTWLRGEEPDDADQWAEGWLPDGPTIEWMARWRTGQLSQRELEGGKTVAFAVECSHAPAYS